MTSKNIFLLKQILQIKKQKQEKKNTKQNNTSSH